MFPSPTDCTQPLPVRLARTWLLKAERLAGLSKLDGAAWHSYRRGFATERKGMPLKEVAIAGGWSENGQTLQRCYTQATVEGVKAVVDHGLDRCKQAVVG